VQQMPNGTSLPPLRTTIWVSTLRDRREAGRGSGRSRRLLLYDSKGGPLYAVRGVLLNVFIWWTKIVYRRFARQVARDVADYQRAGIAVAGIVGIGASPSCC